MKKLLSLLLFLCLCPLAHGQEQIELSAEKTITIKKMELLQPGEVITQDRFPLEAKAPVGGFGYSWEWPDEVKARQSGSRLTVTAAAKGVHFIKCTYYLVDFDAKKIEEVVRSKSFIVGDGPDPKPPEPDPPKPPDPGPPVPTGGLTVLISYESATKSKLPSAQSQIFTSVPVRQYLIAKCVKDDSPVAIDGKAYRIWDDDENGSGDTKLWQDLVKARPSVGDLEPRIFISNGKTSFEGLLPLTPDETITLLKKYGG